MSRYGWIAGLLLAALASSSASPIHAAAKQRRFESPEQAMSALVDAIKTNDHKSLLAMLGPEGQSLVYSGDAVADRNAATRFAAEYDRAHHIEAGGGKLVLHVGVDDFPFPIPLVPDGPEWRFDTAAGKEEILNRRIGRNELDTIQVCLAYVDAQRDYYSQDRNADGLREYAARFASSPGKRDGLYWATKPGDPPSPLGPLVVRARGEGYGGHRQGTPYHGYLFRILTAQGAAAPDGAYDYMAHGHMIGGFALVAYPAQYGVSGVMTFIVSHDGVVYQKDLGPDTASIARAMKLYNPDPTWTKA